MKAARMTSLLLLCAALSAILYLELQEPVGSVAGPLTGGDAKTAPAAPLADRPAAKRTPIETYAAVVERPLFARSRRPPAVPRPVEQANGRPPVRAALTGIVVSPETRLALVQIEGAPEPRRIAEGDKLEGWTLEAVHAAHVVLRQGDATRKLVLHDPARPSRPTAPGVARAEGSPSPEPQAEQIRLAQREHDEGAASGIAHRPGSGSRLASAIERLKAATAARNSTF